MEMLMPLFMMAAVVAGVTPAERLLSAHNAERATVNMKPLAWSATLATDAQRWAEKLAKSGQFNHADGADNAGNHGENLWMGTRGAYTLEEMVGSWTNEKRMFKPGRFPDVSTTKNWMDVGHYTQLIWHSSRSVGCAIVANRSDDYLVCRYDPPGNWVGQDPFGADTIPPKRKGAKKIRH